MRLFAQTRGKTVDYSYLGAAPSTRWWLDLRDATSFEQPTLIVRGDRHTWRCYFSGIPSRRTDRVGTTIRYTLVLEDECSHGVDEALRVVSAWLSDACSFPVGERLPAVLDGIFEEPFVESLLAERSGLLDDAAELERNALAALAILPSVQAAPTCSVTSWVGAMSSAQSRSEFLARSGEILRGEHPGTAALLNLVGSAEEVAELAERLGSLAVLIDDTQGTLGDGIVPIKNVSPPAGVRTSAPSKSDRLAVQAANRNGAPGFLAEPRSLVPEAARPSPEKPISVLNEPHAGEALPLGGFRLRLEGTWWEGRLSKRRSLRIELEGAWQLLPARTHSADVSGSLSAQGFIETAVPIKGTLTVKLPELGVNLDVAFVAPDGVQYLLRASARTGLVLALRGSAVKGTLSRGDKQIARVELPVDLAMLKKGLPTIITNTPDAP